MRLFDIFKKSKVGKASDKSGLFYHEDDYCQIELSPKENLLLFQNESEKINDLAKKSFDGYGYTDIYVRNDKRIKLEERKINPNELERIVETIGLGRSTNVTTGYGQKYRKTCNNTIGFGKDYSAIYFDFKDGIVGHIWLTNLFSMDRQKLTECLFQVGQKWDLLLVDWNQTFTVDLTNRNEIEKYLTN